MPENENPDIITENLENITDNPNLIFNSVKTDIDKIRCLESSRKLIEKTRYHGDVQEALARKLCVDENGLFKLIENLYNNILFRSWNIDQNVQLYKTILLKDLGLNEEDYSAKKLDNKHHITKKCFLDGIDILSGPKKHYSRIIKCPFLDDISYSVEGLIKEPEIVLKHMAANTEIITMHENRPAFNPGLIRLNLILASSIGKLNGLYASIIEDKWDFYLSEANSAGAETINPFFEVRNEIIAENNIITAAQKLRSYPLMSGDARNLYLEAIEQKLRTNTYGAAAHLAEEAGFTVRAFWYNLKSKVAAR